jgi:WD40 repeat protein
LVSPKAKEISWRGIVSFDNYPSKKLFAYAYENDIEVVKFSNPLDDQDLFNIVRRLGIGKEKIEVGEKLTRPIVPRDSAMSIIVEKITTLSGHSGAITSISISPDGKYLASGSNDKSVKLWDLSSGREIFTLKGHSDIVTSVDLSPDGNYLVSGSRDKTIMVWQIKAIMNHLWLGLEHPYKEKNILELLLNIEKQTGLSLKNMMPIDASPVYSGISISR